MSISKADAQRIVDVIDKRILKITGSVALNREMFGVVRDVNEDQHGNAQEATVWLYGEESQGEYSPGFRVCNNLAPDPGDVVRVVISGTGDRRIEEIIGAKKIRFKKPDGSGYVDSGPDLPQAQGGVLDHFERSGGGLVVHSTASGVDHLYVEGDTFATVALPSGWESREGSYVLAAVHSADDTSVDSSMEEVGFLAVSFLAGNTLFFRKIDGTEGSLGWTEDEVIVTFAGDTVELGAVTMLVSGLYAEFDEDRWWLWWAMGPGATADPDEAEPDSEWLGEPAIAITTIRTNGGAITGGPSGYSHAGTNEGDGIDLRVDYRILDEAAAEDPSTYTATGTEATETWLIRGVAGGDVEGWGAIPFGFGVETDSPWIGGNEWRFDIQDGDADFYLEDGAGVIEITSDNTVVSANVGSDSADQDGWGPPGPWSVGRVEKLVRWKVNPIGNPTDIDRNAIHLNILGVDGTNARGMIFLGDDFGGHEPDPGNDRGVAIGNHTGEHSGFANKTIESDTWYYTRMDTRGPFHRIKLWEDGDSEPSTWDAEIAHSADSTNEGGQFAIRFMGQSGMKLWVEHIDANMGGQAGGLATGLLTMPSQGSSPGNPPAGAWVIYFKSDGAYYMDSDGNEHKIDATAV